MALSHGDSAWASPANKDAQPDSASKVMFSWFDDQPEESAPPIPETEIPSAKPNLLSLNFDKATTQKPLEIARPVKAAEPIAPAIATAVKPVEKAPAISTISQAFSSIEPISPEFSSSLVQISIHPDGRTNVLHTSTTFPGLKFSAIYRPDGTSTTKITSPNGQEIAKTSDKATTFDQLFGREKLA